MKTLTVLTALSLMALCSLLLAKGALAQGGSIWSLPGHGALSVSAAVRVDAVAPFSNGEEKPDAAFVGQFSAAAELTLAERAPRMFFQVLGQPGGSVSESLGDMQGASNIEAPRALRLYQAWAEVELGSFSLLAGLHDLNSEFYATGSSALLLNSSFGVGPELAKTGSNGPSIFPVASPALRARATLDRFEVGAAIYDGHPGAWHAPASRGVLLVGEAALATPGFAPRLLKVAIGGWRYSRAAHAEGAGHTGAYLLLENALTDVTAEGEANAAVFLRAGRAFGGEVPGSVQLGARLGEFSAGVAWVRVASEEGEASDETALEATWRAQVFERFSVQPDVQWILRPGADVEAPSAWMAGGRFEIAI